MRFPGTAFSDYDGWGLTNLYWKQYFAGGKGAAVAGFLTYGLLTNAMPASVSADGKVSHRIIMMNIFSEFFMRVQLLLSLTNNNPIMSDLLIFLLVVEVTSVIENGEGTSCSCPLTAKYLHLFRSFLLCAQAHDRMRGKGSQEG